MHDITSKEDLFKSEEGFESDGECPYRILQGVPMQGITEWINFSCAQHCRSEKALLWVGQIGASQAGLLDDCCR